MKTGKRKTQKYMSAILIAAMSMSHVTGVWAEPVNTQEIAEEKALSEEEGKKQEEALPEEGEKLEEEVLQEDEEEKTEEGAAAESVPGVEEQKEETLEMEVPVENEKITVVRGESLQLEKPESFSENVDFSLFRPLEFFVDPKNGDGRNNNPPAMRVRVDCYTKKLPFRVQ